MRLEKCPTPLTLTPGLSPIPDGGDRLLVFRPNRRRPERGISTGPLPPLPRGSSRRERVLSVTPLFSDAPRPPPRPTPVATEAEDREPRRTPARDRVRAD